MEEIIKTVTEKISSYNIFNNLFPGVIFCCALNRITRFTFSSDNIIEQLFIWYFEGMVISRIGSIFIEGGLKKLKIKKQPYIVFADYKQYSAASEAKPFIATLSEVNNTYRTIIALLISLSIIYLYDIFVFDWIAKFLPIGNEIAFIALGIFLVLLFVKSYKKQTDYVRRQVEKYISDINSTTAIDERSDN